MDNKTQEPQKIKPIFKERINKSFSIKTCYELLNDDLYDMINTPKPRLTLTPRTGRTSNTKKVKDNTK